MLHKRLFLLYVTQSYRAVKGFKRFFWRQKKNGATSWECHKIFYHLCIHDATEHVKFQENIFLRNEITQLTLAR